MREYLTPTLPDVYREPPGPVLDCWAGAVCLGLTGLGYYGPVGKNTRHDEYRRFDTAAEAGAAYLAHWGEDVGMASDPMWWQPGWGPRRLPEVSRSFDWEQLVDRLLAANPGAVLVLDGRAGRWTATVRRGSEFCGLGDTRALAATRACLVAVILGGLTPGSGEGL